MARMDWFPINFNIKTQFGLAPCWYVSLKKEGIITQRVCLSTIITGHCPQVTMEQLE